jgi:hypothetical protein
MNNMDIGEEWIYRLRPYSPSERVQIIALEKRKQTTRVEVEFVDGDKVGRRENVPAIRLPRRWSDVAEYDELMANWQLLDGDSLDETEDWAVTDVFDLLLPEGVAVFDRSHIRHGTSIYRQEALERIMRCPLTDVLEHDMWFEHAGTVELSARGSLLIAECVCRADPVPVLEKVMASEVEARDHCKRGRTWEAHRDSGDRTTTPEWEYEWYRAHLRPVYELLRQWCGHRSVSFYERLTAAEAEVRRLDILVAKLIDTTKEHNPFQAEIFEREHDEERIRPETLRPVVDRPLAPWEIPVIEMPARRRGRWW